MNIKDGGILFLLTVLCIFAGNWLEDFVYRFVYQTRYGYDITVMLKVLLPAVPAVIYMLIRKDSAKAIIPTKTNVKNNIIYSILFGLLLMPAVIFSDVNGFYLIRPKDMHVVFNSYDGAVDAVLLICGNMIFPILIEEITYRGLLLRCYEKAGRLKAVIITSALFGLSQFPFGYSQCVFAFLFGIALGMLNEATRQIYPSMIVHLLVAFLNNHFNTAMTYGDTSNDKTMRLVRAITETLVPEYSAVRIITIIVVIGAVSFICIVIAKKYLLTALMKQNAIQIEETESRGKILTIPLVIGITLSVLGIIVYIYQQHAQYQQMLSMCGY